MCIRDSFHPETVAAQLLARADEVKIPDRETKEDENFVSSNSLQPVEISDEVKIPDRESKNASSSGKNASTIPEITPEITPESLGERARAHEAEHLKAFEQRFSPAPSYTCPEEFVPSPAIRDWATRVYPAVDFEAALAAMRVWESPRPVRNWNLKLKSFVQKEPTFRARSPGGNHYHTTPDALSARRTREQNVEQRFLETYHARSRGPAGLSGGDETVIDDVQYRTDR